AAHDAGLYVIQDIVVNHVCDYFTVAKSEITGYSSLQFKRWSLNSSNLPTPVPEQLPWSLNNPSKYLRDEFYNNSFYHWTPPVSDFNNKKQLLTYQMSNLDDINTDNKVVQNLLRGYFRYWIDKVDVDGYRVDTVKYVPPEFFEDFTNSTESGNKGIREHAKDLGKNDFIVFGEAWDRDESFCAGYTKDPVSGANRMDSSIYFTLAFAIRDVFISGESTKKISDVLNQRYTAGYANPDKLVTFIDNHDMLRALQGTSADMLKAAYSIIFTIPGIPQLYYGTEQGFTVTRRAMFKGGYKSQGYVNEEDMFNENSEWYKYFQNLTKMRANNEVFRKGAVTVLEDTDNGPGIFAYKVVQDTGGIGKSAIVLINTSNENKAIVNIPTGFNSGDKFTRLSPYSGTSDAGLLVETEGKLTTLLGANSFAVYLLSEVGAAVPDKNNEIVITKIVTDSTTDPVTLVTGDNLTIEGTLDSAADIRAFIDGEYNTVVSQSKGTTWSVTLPPLTSLSEGIHTVTALIDTGDPSTYIFSNVLRFNYSLKYTEVVSINDPVGDDTGPEGKAYTLPTDATFIGNHQDITKVRVLTAGSNMRIELTMRNTTKVWGPTKNDFDHVEFSIFFQKAGSTSTVNLNPNHNYTLPGGFVWDYLTMQEGWSAVMYEKTGATATNYGTSITPVPYSEVLHDESKIIFTVKGNMIGKPSSLSGWKIYISTWDADMSNPRGLEEVSAQYRFGGGDGLVDPLVMDETAIITIP
ncbi:MAG TPA: alpha-amylase family glycosyl hydrolase, partial [Spirochaetota bacterium]|nr:alpha-amylase family glycosyl hydrolase [Spirochaetota bacterium]